MGIQTLAGQESYRGEVDLTSYSYSVSLLQLGGVKMIHLLQESKGT